MAEPTLFESSRTVKHFQEEAVWASGVFTVDPQGRVWRGARRVEHRTPAGYLQVRVMIDGLRHHTGAHRLVWRALRGPIPTGQVVNHLNGRKDDNRPENLELTSYSGNTKHAYKAGLVDEHGQRNPAAKLTDNEVGQIRSMYARGGYTMEKLGDIFGVQFQHISRLVRGQRRPKQGGPIISSDLRHNVCTSDPITGQFQSRKVG